MALTAEEKKRFEKIVVDYGKSAGVDFFQRRVKKTGKVAEAWVTEDNERVITGPPPTSVDSLYVLLHEISHHYYDHVNHPKAASTEEWEATKKAFEVMKANGVEVPAKTLREAKWNVEAAIKRDKRNKVTPDPDAVKFVEGKMANPGIGAVRGSAERRRNFWPFGGGKRKEEGPKDYEVWAYDADAVGKRSQVHAGTLTLEEAREVAQEAKEDGEKNVTVMKTYNNGKLLKRPQKVTNRGKRNPRGNATSKQRFSVKIGPRGRGFGSLEEAYQWGVGQARKLMHATFRVVDEFTGKVMEFGRDGSRRNPRDEFEYDRIPTPDPEWLAKEPAVSPEYKKRIKEIQIIRKALKRQAAKRVKKAGWAGSEGEYQFLQQELNRLLREQEKENPAVSGKQYRLAQAVLSGKSDRMPVEVARELVEETPEGLREKWAHKNPADSASAMYDSFHGFPSTETVTVSEDEHYHGHLAAIGILVELQVDTPSGHHAIIGFDAGSTDLEDNPVMWPWVGKDWVPYKTFVKEIDAQRALAKLEDRGIVARLDRVRVRLVPTPKYKWEVLVHRGNVRDALSRNPVTPKDYLKFLEDRISLLSSQHPSIKSQNAIERMAAENLRDYRKELSDYLRTGKIKANPRGHREGPFHEAGELVGGVTGALYRPIDEFTRTAGSVGDYLDRKLVGNPNDESTITTHSRSTYLCTNEDGTQMYIVGGDQSIDLASLKIKGKEADHDSILLGDLTHVVYHTRKEFKKGEVEEYDYIHELSEESDGPLPVLIYDRMNKRLSISGGVYHIPKPFTGTSPGITD